MDGVKPDAAEAAKLVAEHAVAAVGRVVDGLDAADVVQPAFASQRAQVSAPLCPWYSPGFLERLVDLLLEAMATSFAAAEGNTRPCELSADFCGQTFYRTSRNGTAKCL